MRNRKAVSVFIKLSLCLLLWCSGQSIGMAQQPRPTAQGDSLPLPVIPFIVEYDYAPLYFMQRTNDDPHYSRVAAVVRLSEPPLYQIILTEKGGGDVYYCNSKERVESLRREGKQANFTQIDFRATRNVEQPTTYGFGFRDVHGRAILWRFVPATQPSERGSGLIPLPTAPGLHLMYRHLGTAAGAGTAVQIGERLNEAEPWAEISAPPYFVAYHGSHAEGMDDGALLTGNETWSVVSAPKISGMNELREGAQWTLRETKGRERTLRVTARRADEITIAETNNSSRETMLEIVAHITAQSFALRAVRLHNGAQYMRVAFTPELNLTNSSASLSNGDVGFEIDLGTHRRVAQGTVSVERQGGTVRLRWMPKTPEWAKSRTLVSTIRMDANGYMIESSQAAGQPKR